LVHELKIAKNVDANSNSSDDDDYLKKSLMKEDERHVATPTIYVLKKNAERNLINQRPRETLFYGDSTKMLVNKNSQSMPAIDNVSHLKLAPIYPIPREERYVK